MSLRLAAALVAGLLAAAPAPVATAGPAPAASGPRPWLGIGVTELAEEESEAAPGLTLARVTVGSPAEAAGLREGDVLLALDGRILEGAADLKAALAQRRPGDAVRLTVLHEGRARTLAVELGTAPASESERRVLSLPTPPPKPTTPRVAPVPPAPPVPPTPPSRDAPAIALTFLGPSERPSLGLETMDLEPGLAAYFGVPAGQGVLVETVAAGSPAAKAGVRAGDVVLSLGGRAVGDGASLAQALRDRAPGERVALSVVRDGRRLELVPILAAEAVSAWRVESSAPPPAAAGEALAALAQHQAREIARLESLLAAQEAGSSELRGLVAKDEATLAQRAQALRERLAALKLEQQALERSADAPRR